MFIYHHMQAGKTVIQNLSFEISHGFQAVVIFFCSGILQHYHSSFIICIADCKGADEARNQTMIFLP